MKSDADRALSDARRSRARGRRARGRGTGIRAAPPHRQAGRHVSPASQAADHADPGAQRIVDSDEALTAWAGGSRWPDTVDDATTAAPQESATTRKWRSQHVQLLSEAIKQHRRQCLNLMRGVMATSPTLWSREQHPGSEAVFGDAR